MINAKTLLSFLCSLIIFATTHIDCSFAQVKTLKGKIANDPGSKITIKIQRVGGAPFRVTEFKFQNVSFKCFGGAAPGKISGTIGRMDIKKSSNPFNPRVRTNVYFSKSGQLTKDKKIGVFITGIANDKATSTSGNFGISFGDGCSEGGKNGFKKFSAKS